PNLVLDNDALHSGGGISVRNAELTTTSVAVRRNHAQNGMGGGIFSSDESPVGWTEPQVLPCERACHIDIGGALVEHNEAKLGGGGIAIVEDLPREFMYGSARVHNSIIRGNRSDASSAGILVLITA